MAHRYARRTWDEAQALARDAFRAAAAGRLSAEELAELGVRGRLTGGTPGADWASVLGHAPTERDFYELELYEPAPERPYVEKSYVRMLVPRDRSTDRVHFMWRPEVRRD